MAEFSYPFDAGSGSVLTEQQWANLATPWQDDGIIADGPATTVLKITTLAGANTVYVEPGHAAIQGFHYENDLQKALTFATNSGGSSRTDSIVLRLDRTTNVITAVYKSADITITRAGAIYEIQLATLVIAAGASTVASGSITDKREFVGRRYRVSNTSVTTLGPDGTLLYRPSDSSLHLNSAGTNKTIATTDLIPADSGSNLVRMRASNLVRSTNAVTSDTLVGTFDLVVGFVYEVYIRLIWTCSVTTTNVSTFRLSALPSGGSLAYFTAATVGVSQAVSSSIVSDITVGLNTTCESATVPEVLILQGVIIPATSGNVAFQWGPNAASVSTTVQAGSYSRLTRGTP